MYSVSKAVTKTVRARARACHHAPRCLCLTAALVSLLLANLVFFFPGPAVAGSNVSITRTFSSSGDNYLDVNGPDYNNGGRTFLLAGSDVKRRPLLKFATGSSGIPTTATVSATAGDTQLNLYYYLGGGTPAGRTYWAYRILERDWVEGTSTGGTQAGSSSWTYRAYSTSSWTNAGAGSPTSSTTTDGASVTAPASYDWMRWDVGAQVQTAVTGGFDAHFMVRDGSEDATYAQPRFYSREEATETTKRPYLTVKFTADWDSYSNSGRTNVSDSFSDSGATIYMKGTGYASGTYDVGYYDGNGTLKSTDASVQVTTGELDSQVTPANTSGSASGSWHVLVQPASATAFDSSYATTVASPDTYQLSGNDSFNVDASAIPEFPGAVEAASVVALSLTAYVWLRRRRGPARVR